MITRNLNILPDGREIPENTDRAFPLTLHYDDLQNWPEPRVGWHWHAEVELSVVARGSVRVSTNGVEYVLGEGDGYFINRDVMHRMSAEPGASPILMTLLMNASLLGGAPGSALEEKYVAPLTECRAVELLPLRMSDTNARAILAHLREAYDAADPEEFGYELRARNALSAAWLRLLRQAAPQLQAGGARERPEQRRVKAMMLFIRENRAEKLTLEQIARAANVSPRECLRCFRNALKTTPFGYLLEQRLLAALQELKTTDKSIAEIAVDNGFSTPSYFTKCFRERFGTTPTAQRQNHGL